MIVQFTETMNGIRAVLSFRREPRNEEIFAGAQRGNQDANGEAFWLIAVFMPGVRLIGNLTIGTCCCTARSG